MTPTTKNPIPDEWQPPPVTGHAETDGMAVIRHVVAGRTIALVADEQIAQAIHVAPRLYAGQPSDVLVRAINRAVDELTATQRRRAAHLAELDAAIAELDRLETAAGADAGGTSSSGPGGTRVPRTPPPPPTLPGGDAIELNPGAAAIVRTLPGIDRILDRDELNTIGDTASARQYANARPTRATAATFSRPIARRDESEEF